MKNLIFIFLSVLLLVSCADNQELTPKDDKSIEGRSATTVYFYDGLGEDPYYNELTGEYEIDIEEDFEFKPYGETTWYGYAGPKKLKLSCKCISGASEGYCNPVIVNSYPVQADCDNPCSAGCRKKTKITNSYGISVAEYELGGEVRLQ